MEAKFRDRHEQRDDRKVVELTRQRLADPQTAASPQDHMASDPHQAAYAAIWLDRLSRPVEEIAARLPEDSPQGDLLRQTRPPFGRGFRSRAVARIVEAMDAATRSH